MKRIALIFAVLYATFVTGVVLHFLVGTLGPNEPISHFQVVLHLSICATVAILAGATGQAFALLLGVAITRGPAAIGWVRPSECRDLIAWLSYEWISSVPAAGRKGFVSVAWKWPFTARVSIRSTPA